MAAAVEEFDETPENYDEKVKVKVTPAAAAAAAAAAAEAARAEAADAASLAGLRRVLGAKSITLPQANRLYNEAVARGVWKPLSHQSAEQRQVWRKNQERARVLEGKRRLKESRAGEIGSRSRFPGVDFSSRT
jgi:hypothetical protein